jgi:biopolymer transport protein TolQ
VDESVWGLVTGTLKTSGPVEGFVLLFLIGLSVVSWTFLVIKIYQFRTARKNGVKFLSLFERADCLGTIHAAASTAGPSPLAAIFETAMRTLNHKREITSEPVAVSDPRHIPLTAGRNAEDALRMTMQHTSEAEFSRLQYGLSFLATVGSTSPFIGLFGTVWGIMATFRALGAANSTSLSVVAPGISSALIATAAGLAVAIPALIGYNWFSAQVNGLQEGADQFIEHLNALVHASGYLKQEPTAATPASPAQVPLSPVRPSHDPAVNLQKRS